MTYETYALWGKGELSEASAVALLEEYIPDNVGTVYRPEVVDRQHQGLRTALGWFESPDFLGDGGAIPTTDIVQSLTFDRDTQGDSVTVLALWPAEPGHEDFDFIESVQAAGITVLDLSRAMDELDLSLYSRPVPTTEEKAEARAAARAEAAEKKPRGRPRKLSDTAKEEGVVPEVTSTGSIQLPLPEPGREPVVAAKISPEVIRDVSKDAFFASLDMYIEYKVEEKVAEILARRGLEDAAKEAVAFAATVDERPPFEGPYVDIDTKPYFVNLTTGASRPATGKPRRGEVVKNLTQEEIDNLPPF